jgi:hypothetical protein
VISWKFGFTSRPTKARRRLTIGLTVLKRGAANWRNSPSQDRLAPDIADDARMLVIVRWLALYEITKGGVRIMRVVDAARDLAELDLSGE